ncbi:thiamine-phosphate diphosphorylase [Sinobacterium caligoides]|uniref:Thiamine-phosphate synthase n=1 Tax=Sinobacterium caligoides TaxID=933926 RepID=A0A3N2DPB5_9GAMM|nr:thiamine phosphate synthase [Sinobacterium caligoides]ROS01616.1 thiamine-phosphate diphosphorylase [Sinobacterium caligoides]
MTELKKPIVWTIAGSDSGGGAGIQADLATFNDFAVHGCSVVTALTAQNSVAVTAIAVTDTDHVRAEMSTLSDDLPAQAIKLGMLANSEIIGAVVEQLSWLNVPVVCDPVLMASSGRPLLDEAARGGLLHQLFPCCTLITPNIPEAEMLTGLVASKPGDIEQMAAQLLSSGTKAVLIKGGHSSFSGQYSDSADRYCCDYFSDGQQSFWLQGDLIDNDNNHGSGCTLASAITALLGQGYPLEDAVCVGKFYITEGIVAGQRLGQGHGPIGHQGFPSKLGQLPRLFKSYPDTLASSLPKEVAKLGLYPVVDSVAWIARLLPLGVKTIQLRVKDLQGEALSAEVAAAVELAKQHDARLYINDYWQLAIEHGAYGVHLGQEDLDDASVEAIAQAGLRLGVSTHCWSELCRAHAIAPSYIAIGPIYDTTTKQMRFGPQGLEQLTQWLEVLQPGYPVVAIGGIDYTRAKLVQQTGVGSIALVSAITQAEDWQGATEALLALVGAGSGAPSQ